MLLEQGDNMENVVEKLLVRITGQLMDMSIKINKMDERLVKIESLVESSDTRLKTLEGSTTQFAEQFGDLEIGSETITNLLSSSQGLTQGMGGVDISGMMQLLRDNIQQISSRLEKKSPN
jgi:hypothetical protein